MMDSSRDLQFQAKWREWLQRQADSGLDIPTFCRQHDLPRSTFYGWRYKLARRAGQHAAEPTFMPVKVTPSAAPTPAGCVEILLDGGHRVRLSGPVDRRMLHDVLAVLEAQPC